MPEGSVFLQDGLETDSANELSDALVDVRPASAALASGAAAGDGAGVGD
jgi:hypothetical protein